MFDQPVPVKPHCISEEIHLFSCPMREISTLKIQRDADGEIDYLGLVPIKGTILCAFECSDGAMIVIWSGE